MIIDNMRIKQIQTIAICVFCILAQITYAQQKQTMLQKENLKGKIKSVYLTNGSESFVKTYFDETGKLIKKEIKHSTNPLHINDYYVYDSNDRLISYLAYSEDKPSNIIGKLVYEYNEAGLVESFGTQGQTRYEYDEKGNCILEIRDNDYTKVKRTYNRENQVIEELTYDEGGHIMNVWRTDNVGNSYEESALVGYRVIAHMFYEYNEFGDISRITAIYGEREPITDMITYRYDDKENWIERIHSNGTIHSYSAIHIWAFNSSKLYTRIIEYNE